MSYLDTATLDAPAVARHTFPREGTFRLHDTGLFATEETVDKSGMLEVLHSVVGRLTFRGWRVTRDPDVEAHYKSLGPDHRYARKGDLELKIAVRGRCFEAQFFQNLNVENRNGGQYDFQKYARMPRTMQLLCIVEVRALVVKLQELGYRLENVRSDGLLDIREALVGRSRWGALDDFDQAWDGEFERKTGRHRFERDATGWPTAKEIGTHVDRDGVPIVNGEVRYVRHNGRLMRGVVRPNMNGMWFVGDFACVSSHEVLSCDNPDREPPRLVPKQLERLHREATKALEAKNYRRLSAIGAAAARLAR